MKLSENNIRLIFGLKLKQLRLDKNLSLSDLARKSSLSVSYLNEIENGRKHPKPDKTAALAKALEVPYDEIVSLKLTKSLAPIRDLLESNILEQLPLDHYGIDVHKLLLQISQAPLQLSALVSTLIELAKSLELSENNFSKTAIRTYKELNENYFPEIEESVEKFCRKVKFHRKPPVMFNAILTIFTNELKYKVDEESIPDIPELRNIRGINIPGKASRKLLINKRLTDSQKAFILGKEIAYNYMNITDRAQIYSDLRLDSFDQLLNNLKASYFSTAMIINKTELIADLKKFFAKKYFDGGFLLSLMDKYNASPEMLFQRITNILSRYFNISGFFFHRFNSEVNSDIFHLSKEIRLNTKENPGGYQTTEHYCRRWISIRLIKELEMLQSESKNIQTPIAGIQKSIFTNSKNEYLNISAAKSSTLLERSNYSVTLGFLINDELKSKINFWNESEIPVKIVNDTCESCQITDCKERVAPPFVYEKNLRLEKLLQDIQKLVNESRA